MNFEYACMAIFVVNCFYNGYKVLNLPLCGSSCDFQDLFTHENFLASVYSALMLSTSMLSFMLLVSIVSLKMFWAVTAHELKIQVGLFNMFVDLPLWSENVWTFFCCRTLEIMFSCAMPSNSVCFNTQFWSWLIFFLMLVFFGGLWWAREWWECLMGVGK